MKIANCFLSLALALTIASGALAGDGEKKGEAKGEKKAAAGEKGEKKPGAAREKGAKGEKKPGAKRGERKAPSVAAMVLRGIELTKEQKEAMAPTEKDFAPKFAELNKSRQAIYTPEQKTAQKEVFAKAREAGKKPDAETRKQLAEVMKLSPEQKEKFDEIRASFGKLRTDFLAKVDVILTPEQKEKLKSRRGGKKPGAGKKPGEGDKKPRRKKGDDAKAADKTAKSA
jgi:Spy/CpxP family protein refolding chaperone